jgi:superfamily II DNA or RNA helicase
MLDNTNDTIYIAKYNEVYCKVICSDRGIAMELHDFFSFFVPGYKFMPAYKNKFWDGKIRLYDVNKKTLYKGLIPYIETFATEREYATVFEEDMSTENFSLAEANQFVKEQKFKLKPYDYQVKTLVDAVRNSRQLFLSPTASGKSFMIYMILRYYLRPTLIIVPTVTLVHQMYSDFEDYGFNSEKYMHKIYSGKSKDTDKPIVITTWQSIFKLNKSWFDKFDVVIGDEAHHFKSKSLTSIMTKLVNCKYRFGFTGTLDGTETHRLVLEGLFGKVNKVTTTKKLMDTNKVSKLITKILVLSHSKEQRELLHKQKAQLSGSEKYIEEINMIVSSEKRNQFIKNLTISLEGNTMLLFQYVKKHGAVLYDLIKNELKDTDRKVFFVHGGVDGEDRDQIRKIVENENNAIIVASYGTFSTGINIPKLHNIIFASSYKSIIKILQSIGRSIRKHETKEYATLYDIADDLTHNKKKNYSLDHLIERINIYDGEEFEYKIYTIGLK